jgi:NADP-dependent 3-hydroxy acid dehydrogenase YdfG
LAHHVLAQGNRCVVTARDLSSIQSLLSSHPDQEFLACTLDVTDLDQIHDVLCQAASRFGRIDVLVNNAGFGYNAGVEEGNEQDVRKVFETNFSGLAALTRAVLPSMRTRRKGHVFNISSIRGRVANPGSSYSAASKFAVEGFSQGLAKEVAPRGIRVTVIEPGPLRPAAARCRLRRCAGRRGSPNKRAGRTVPQTLPALAYGPRGSKLSIIVPACQ